MTIVTSGTTIPNDRLEEKFGKDVIYFNSCVPVTELMEHVKVIIESYSDSIIITYNIFLIELIDVMVEDVKMFIYEDGEFLEADIETALEPAADLVDKIELIEINNFKW